VTLAPQRQHGSAEQPPPATPRRTRRPGPGAYPWAMSGAVAVGVAGAALSLNGVLRGWAWYLPVLTTILVVSLTMAGLRALRAQPLLVTLGGFVSLLFILGFTFFRRDNLAGFIPTDATMTALGRHLRRASETVLSESSPVAPNAGIVLVTCAALGLVVILVDALALPLGMPATSGLGLLAVLVVPAMIKPQSIGVAGFLGTAIGFLLILACSQWFSPDARIQADTSRNPGQAKRAALSGAVALVTTLVLQLVIPGFDQGTFPQGSRLNPWASSSGLNPMISLGNSLRRPTGDGRITYATNAATPLYLRSVTVDRFDGEAWSPDDRDAARRAGPGRMETGHEILAPEQVRTVTAVNTGDFTSPYLPAPYAPEAVNGLSGRWSWDPATLSIKGTDTNSRNQQYLVRSTAPKLTTELLDQSSAAVSGIPEEFVRPPANVPEIVRTTADSVTSNSRTAFEKAMALQRFLRSADFTYSLESPIQGGYDGNGLSVLADFLTQKSGYCIHFASAMAVMARVEGIPSRIAVGYAPGRLTGATVFVPGQGALPEFEVDARDAHAWPELYFQGLGWVPFEPTPSRGVVPAYAQDPSSGGASTNDGNDGLLPTSGAVPPPVTPPAPLPLPEGGEAPAGNQSLMVIYGAAGVLVLLLVAASPRLVRTSVRSRRLRVPDAGQGPDPAPLAWSELRDLATDYGVPPSSSETPRAFSARLRSFLALPRTAKTREVEAPARAVPVQSAAEGQASAERAAEAAVQDLTAAYERHEYGRPGPVPGAASGGSAAGAENTRGENTWAENIAAVRKVLRRNAGVLGRLRAEWLPPSVMARWGHTAGAPFRAAGRAAARAGRAVAGSWTGARDGLRRLRDG
jgi:transglutaminase-like putative cysteine protease